MKLKNADRNWDMMPANAFDDLANKHYQETYTELYDYTVEVENEVRRQRKVIEMYKNEIRALNKANARKAFRLNVVKLYNKMFK